MAHTPTTLAILRGSARFTRVGLLVLLAAGVVPLAYGAVHIALGTAGAAGFVAGQARSFLVVAYVVLVGWVLNRLVPGAGEVRGGPAVRRQEELR